MTGNEIIEKYQRLIVVLQDTIKQLTSGINLPQSRKQLASLLRKKQERKREILIYSKFIEETNSLIVKKNEHKMRKKITDRELRKWGNSKIQNGILNKRHISILSVLEQNQEKQLWLSSEICAKTETSPALMAMKYAKEMIFFGYVGAFVATKDFASNPEKANYFLENLNKLSSRKNSRFLFITKKGLDALKEHKEKIKMAKERAANYSNSEIKKVADLPKKA